MSTTEILAILVIISMIMIPIMGVISANATSDGMFVISLVLFIGFIFMLIISGTKLRYDYYKEVVNKQQEAIKLEEEAKQDVKDGYAVYVDCKEVDSTAVIFDWSTYKVTINDDTKTVYLEKISGNVVN